MKEDPFFSIVMPIYKVEKFLKECIESILSQTYHDYELILVDDGSPDQCGKICDSYREINSAISVIHKQNGGLSDARNAGIDLAKGKYIIFIDSDDFLNDIFALEKINEKLIQTDADVLIFGWKKLYDDGRTINKDKFIYRTQDTIKDLISQNYFKACAWDKVVKRSIIKENDLRFPLNMRSEDIQWCAELLITSNKIGVLNDNIYTYRQRKNSISKTIDTKHIEDILCSLEKSIIEVKDTNKENLVYNYLAYEYTVLLGLINNETSEIKERVYEKKFLLNYNLSHKVKKVKMVSNFLGIKITAKLLEIYIKMKG